MDRKLKPSPMTWSRAFQIAAVLLLLAILLWSIDAFFAAVFGPKSVEQYYPQIEEAYLSFYEKGEQIYNLMLPYVEANELGLDWYGCSSSVTPWQEGARIILNELEVEYKQLFGSMRSNAIAFTNRNANHWYFSLDIPGTNNICLYYYPYDVLPIETARRLDGMRQGWFFVMWGYI